MDTNPSPAAPPVEVLNEAPLVTATANAPASIAVAAPEPPLTPVAFRDLVGERVSLPSGGFAQLRHLDQLRSKHRRHVMAVFDKPGDTTATDGIDMQYAVAEVMIVGWYLPYEEGAPLPSDQPATKDRPSILEELSVRDENVLMKALEPVLRLFNPKDISPDDHADPDSPTGPEGESGPA